MMQRALRSLASRCVGDGCGGARAGQLLDAAARETSDATPDFSCRLLRSWVRPGTAFSASSTASAPSGATTCGTRLPLPAARSSCAWLAHLGPRVPAHARHGGPSQLPYAARAYAKAAKAAAAPATAAAGPKRPRTSWTKLYSCRNDRLRHTHEQIWPTQQLTEAELEMFRRNSRLFVVEMGRAISLQTKYRMGLQLAQPPEDGMGAGTGAAEQGPAAAAAAAAARRVPYQQARSLLHESQLHMDALGENPQYLKVRRVRSLFATKLQNVRKLRLLLGFQRRRFVQRMYEHSLLCRGSHRMWKLVAAMESNLAMFVTRMGLADDAISAIRALRDDKIALNGRAPDMPHRGNLLPGDVVGPAAGSAPYFRRRVAASLAPLEADVVRYIM